MGDAPDTTWSVDKGIRNPRRFFSALATIFPDATLFLAEGGNPQAEVAAFYRTHAAPARARPKSITRLRWMFAHPCLCSPSFFRELATLARTRRPAQLLHHLAVYQGDRQIIDWHDAFANAILLDGALPEATVAALSRRFGVRYGRARVRG